jgi:cytidylate kinase
MVKTEIITLGGLPGSGKSTVTKLLIEKLNYKYFATGTYARQLAVERGLSLEAFNELVAHDKTIDEQIDREQIRIGQEESHYVIDAHLGFLFIPHSFKVLLTVPLAVSALRIWKNSTDTMRQITGDTATTLEEITEKTARRIQNHETRYLEHYNIHVYDARNYDLVIDTEHKAPEEVATSIIDAYKKWLTL